MKFTLRKKKNPAPLRSRTRRESMHPMRDWIIGLSSATFIFLLGAGVIAYDFRVQFVLPPQSTATSTGNVTYNEHDVERYAEQFREKDARFNMLRGEGAESASPSSAEEEISSDEESDLAPEDEGEYTTPTLSL